MPFCRLLLKSVQPWTQQGPYTQGCRAFLVVNEINAEGAQFGFIQETDLKAQNLNDHLQISPPSRMADILVFDSINNIPQTCHQTYAEKHSLSPARACLHRTFQSLTKYNELRRQSRRLDACPAAAPSRLARSVRTPVSRWQTAFRKRKSHSSLLAILQKLPSQIPANVQHLRGMQIRSKPIVAYNLLPDRSPRNVHSINHPTMTTDR